MRSDFSELLRSPLPFDAWQDHAGLLRAAFALNALQQAGLPTNYGKGQATIEARGKFVRSCVQVHGVHAYIHP